MANVADRAQGPLEREIERLARISGGTLGLGAIHLESGRSVFVNAD